MKAAQESLSYYQQQRQQIIGNKQSYQSIRHISEYGPWQGGEYLHKLSAAEFLNGFDLPSARSFIASKLGRPQEDISPSINVECEPESWAVENMTPNTKMVPGMSKCTFRGLEYVFRPTALILGYQHRVMQTREERFFDQAKYDQALRDCDKSIEGAIVQIEKLKQQELHQKIALLDKEIVETKAQITDVSTKITVANDKKAEYDGKCSKLAEENNQQLASLDQEITKTKSEVANVEASANAEKTKQVEYEKKLADLDAASKQGQIEFEQQKEKVYEILQAADAKQLAFFIAELYGVEGSEEIIKYIKGLGFDANELAAISVAKNNTALLDLALESGADCKQHEADSNALENLFSSDEATLGNTVGVLGLAMEHLGLHHTDPEHA